MDILVVLLAWVAASVPISLFVGRLLAHSARHDAAFVRVSREAVLTHQLRRTAS